MQNDPQVTVARLEAAVWEADRHVLALEQALADWQALNPATLDSIEQDPHSVRLVDQIVYRFTKLQDCLGERVLPATLDKLMEPYEDRPMRDRLDRAEKLGLVSVDDWLRWRELRNRLAHEYPGRAEARWAALCACVDASIELVDAWRRWRAKL